MKYFALLMSILLLLCMPVSSAIAAEISATEIIKATGIPAGLCVHVASGDGALSMALARSGKFLVHGLEKDRGFVEQSREKIRAKGMYGQVTIEHWTEAYLPYANNLVNLLVIEDQGRIPASEILRVLRPFGVAYVQKGGAWKVTKKPWPKGMDEWSHTRHGADGNMASRDTVLTLPKRIQWITSKVGRNFISGGGNNYYGKNVRDGFNSLPLWNCSMKVLVATGERVYGSSGGKLVALDAHTSQQIQSYPEAGSVSRLLHLPGKGGLGKGLGTLIVAGSGVRALDAKSGKLLWSHPGPFSKHIVAGDQNVVFVSAGDVIGLNLSDGKERFKKKHGFAAKSKNLSYRNNVVAFIGSQVHVISAQDGSLLWSKPLKGSMAFAGDFLWIRTKGKERRKVPGFDLRTGVSKKTLSLGYGHCHGLMATDRFFIDGELDFTDVSSGKLFTNQITKAACGKSFLAANGMLYSFSSGCICFPMMKDYMALAPDPIQPSPPAAKRLEKGSVSGSKISKPKKSSTDEWPMYRHDAWRSSCVSTSVPSSAKQLWNTSVGSLPSTSLASEWKKNPMSRAITAPTIAEGLVFVGGMDSHLVTALDAKTGTKRWQFTCNGRVDTPPSIYQGVCLFGTRSGWVYALTAASGELIWRFRVGPRDRRMIAFGQLESAWPLPGTVLIDNGTAYVAAGRHALADGGIHVYALDPRSGQLRWESKIDSIPMPSRRWYGRLGTDFDVFDILAKDGNDLFLSRWNIGAQSGKVTGNRRKSFFSARKSGMAVLRGIWSYTADRPNNRGRRKRPLAAFNDDTIFISGKSLFAAKMEKANGLESKDSQYMEPKGAPRNYKTEWSPYKLLDGMPKKWTASDGKAKAILIAGKTLFVAGRSGINAYSIDKGEKSGQLSLSGSPVWDGMASAYGRIYVSTTSGSVVCFGDPSGAVPDAASSDRLAKKSEPKGTRSRAGANKNRPAKSASNGNQNANTSSAPTGGSNDWASKLRALAIKSIKAGKKPVFTLSSMSQTFMIASIDAKGKMFLKSKVISVPYAWGRLNERDFTSLASSMAAGGDQESSLIAGYFLLKAGRKSQADKFFLNVKDTAAVQAARASAK